MDGGEYSLSLFERLDEVLAGVVADPTVEG